MNDSSSYTTIGTDVDQSICPAGWTLPKDGSITTSGSFQYFVTQYGWDDSSREMTGSYSMWDSPLYFSLSGYWHGSFSDVGGTGYCWSSVVIGSNGAYISDYVYGGYVGPGDSVNRMNGVSVRCVAR